MNHLGRTAGTGNRGRMRFLEESIFTSCTRQAKITRERERVDLSRLV
jgi:hypothetical protein